MRRMPSNCWPTSNQELLLRAAMLDGAQAIPAWEQWRQTVDFNDIDYRSQKLLPLVYHNLTKLSVSGPLIERSKGYYRLTWYKNHLQLHHMAAVLDELDRAGIPTLLLKGSAMAVYYYRDLGLRPMEDFDLLVPWHQRSRAVEMARRWGFQSKFDTHAPHGSDLVDSAGRQLDLHGYAFHSVRNPGIDDTLWESARDCKLHHAPTHVLQPSDHLLHLCARALCAPGGSICWIADALWLLNRWGAEIDWKRLLAEAARRRVTLQLREALNYLASSFAAPVPAWFLSALEQRALSFQEYAAYTSATQGELSVPRSVCVWVRYCAEEARFSRSSILQFIEYFRERWDASTVWQLPARGAMKLVRKIRRGLASRPGRMALPNHPGN